jgi:hypothetical protein
MSDAGRAEREYYQTRDDAEIPMTDCPECDGDRNGCNWCDFTGTVELEICLLCNSYNCRCDADYERQADK